MKQLVRLRMRPSRDGKNFAYFVDYKDEDSKRRRLSLGHTDRQRAKREQAQKERELRVGTPEPQSRKLSDFVTDSLAKTGDQIRASTRQEYSSTMRSFIRVVGDKDLLRVSLQDGEHYRQSCLDEGNSPATVVKKLKEIRCILQMAVKRRQLDENPLAHLQMPKYSAKEVHVFREAECNRIVKAAQDFVDQRRGKPVVRWDLLVLWVCVRGCGGASCSTARGRISIW